MAHPDSDLSSSRKRGSRYDSGGIIMQKHCGFMFQILALARMTTFTGMTSIRNLTHKYPTFICFICGVLSALAQAPTYYFPLLLSFSVLMFHVHNAVNLKEACKYNIAFSMGYFGTGFYWTAIAISFYIEDFWWMIPLSLVGLPLIFCAFTSIVTPIAWRFRNSVYYVMIYSVLWVFVEWITGWIFTGLPWMLTGYSVGFSDALSQFASVVGVLGLSLILLNISGTFYYIWGHGSSAKPVDIFYTIVILGSIYAFGIWRLDKYPTNFSDIKIRIVQPSIPLKQKWNEGIFWQNLHAHANLSLMNTEMRPDIILWSEASVVAPYQIKPVMNYLSEVARTANATLITGAVSKKDNKDYTSLIALDKNGSLLFEYDKIHLVPFGEYIPLRRFIPSNFKKLTHGLEDYEPGALQNDVFDMSGIKLRPMICYESIFAKEVMTQNADLFINITNSSWFGKSSAPYHLFYVNKFRAIENGTPVVVSANSGISGIFDPVGRVLGKTNLGDITSLDMLLPRKITGLGTYARLGLNVILIIVVFLHHLRIILNKII